MKDGLLILENNERLFAHRLDAFMTPSPELSSPNRDAVCAVVVTYNRKDLLRTNLQALLAQTHPVARILVIDNASTDGTLEMVAEEFPATRFPQVQPVQLAENVGGAGGFHEGFRRAFEQGADWLWAMDDDGLPHPECLQKLLAAPEAAGPFRGPLVYAREEMDDPNYEHLSFVGAVKTAAGFIPLRTRADAAVCAPGGIIPDYICVFNGVLIRRDAVDRIGLPKKEFFIWGDEWDYVLRARRLGIPTVTVAGALFWHPISRTLSTKIRVGWLEYEVAYADGPLRNYLLVRNYAYIASHHRGLIAWARHTLKYLIYHGTAAGCFSSWQVLRFSLEGLMGQLQGHRRFLKAS